MWIDIGNRKKNHELNQPVYFENVLTSEWKPGYVLHWGRDFAFVSKEKKSYGSMDTIKIDKD